MYRKYLVPLAAVLTGLAFLATPGSAAPERSVQNQESEPYFFYTYGVQEIPLVRGRTTNFYYNAVGEGLKELRVILLSLPQGLAFVGYRSSPYTIDKTTGRPMWKLKNPNAKTLIVFKIRVLPGSKLYTKAKPACVRLAQKVAKATVKYSKLDNVQQCVRVVAKR